MTCALCEAEAGRYDMTQECCRHRYIACMPSIRRQDYYQQVKREKGVEEANRLIAAVNAVQQKRRERKFQ